MEYGRVISELIDNVPKGQVKFLTNIRENCTMTVSDKLLGGWGLVRIISGLVHQYIWVIDQV